MGTRGGVGREEPIYVANVGVLALRQICIRVGKFVSRRRARKPIRDLEP